MQHIEPAERLMPTSENMRTNGCASSKPHPALSFWPKSPEWRSFLRTKLFSKGLRQAIDGGLAITE